MKNILIVKLVVINDAGEVLLLKRTDTARFRPGDWDFPGGHVDDGEAPFAAVCRELAEETGLQAAVGDCHLFYCHTMVVADDASAVRLIYWMRVRGRPEVRLSNEHAAAEWVSAENVQKIFPHPVFGESIRYGTENKLFVTETKIPTEIVAKCAVMRENGDILVLRRSLDDDSRPGGPDFPGGGVEAGEDYAESAAREMLEEAGISIDPSELQLFYAFSQMKPSVNVQRLAFYAKVKDPEIKLSHEHDKYRWVPGRQVSTEFPHHVWGAAVDYGLEHGIF